MATTSTKVDTKGRKHGGVSPRMPGKTGAAPTAPAHGDFVWNGGPVITYPQIYVTFWGSKWSDAAHQAQAARLVQFVRDMSDSTWMNIMSQYGAGTGAGSAEFVDMSFIATVPATLTDSGIHTVIQNAINNGTIPEPPPNNTTQCVIIFLDESTAVDDPGFGVVMCEATSDNAFGYHDFFTTSGGHNCFYAVIPDLDDACITNSCPGGGCSLNLGETQEQRRTQVASHEFAEMITDPKFPSGWFGPSSDENGDICNGETTTITVGADTWNVQRIYSKTDDINTNGATVCLANAPNPIPLLTGGPGAPPAHAWHNNNLTAAAGAPQAVGHPREYMFEGTATQHVNYTGVDSHVHELWWDGAWHHNDLTVAAGAPTAVGSPDGYMFPAQGSQHVNYRGADDHVHELWWDGAWHHNDLTASAGAPNTVGDPHGYMFPAQGTQHVNYLGADAHIHELWWDGAWHHNDLTAAAGAPSADSSPWGYMFTAQGTQHVNYRGQDDHIHELWWDNTGWHHNDLTAAAGAPNATGAPHGYMFDDQGTQHVNYTGADGHIHELWWDGAWHHNDLAASASAPNAIGSPTGYMFKGQETQHVNYRGVDNHIHELWWNGSWHHNDLTNSAGSDRAHCDPAGYMFNAQGTQHVNYRDENGNIQELWWG